jgi:hypothetical protein
MQPSQLGLGLKADVLPCKKLWVACVESCAARSISGQAIPDRCVDVPVSAVFSGEEGHLCTGSMDVLHFTFHNLPCILIDAQLFPGTND